jgi:hypothetical protein
MIVALEYRKRCAGPESRRIGRDVASELFQNEAEHISALLSDGVEMLMPRRKAFFALRFAMRRDKIWCLQDAVQERHLRGMPSKYIHYALHSAKDSFQ